MPAIGLTGDWSRPDTPASTNAYPLAPYSCTSPKGSTVSTTIESPRTPPFTTSATQTLDFKTMIKSCIPPPTVKDSKEQQTTPRYHSNHRSDKLEISTQTFQTPTPSPQPTYKSTTPVSVVESVGPNLQDEHANKKLKTPTPTPPPSSPTPQITHVEPSAQTPTPPPQHSNCTRWCPIPSRCPVHDNPTCPHRVWNNPHGATSTSDTCCHKSERSSRPTSSVDPMAALKSALWVYPEPKPKKTGILHSQILNPLPNVSPTELASTRNTQWSPVFEEVGLYAPPPAPDGVTTSLPKNKHSSKPNPSSTFPFYKMSLYSQPPIHHYHPSHHSRNTSPIVEEITTSKPYDVHPNTMSSHLNMSTFVNSTQDRKYSAPSSRGQSLERQIREAASAAELAIEQARSRLYQDSPVDMEYNNTSPSIVGSSNYNNNLRSQGNSLRSSPETETVQNDFTLEGTTSRDAVYWTNEGLGHYHRGSIEAAEECYMKALSMQPSYFPALHNYATLLDTNNKDLNMALRYYKKALNLAGHSHKGLVAIRMAQLLVDMKRLDEAEDIYKESLVMDNKNVSLLLAYAQFLRNQGNSSQALNTYKKAISEEPQNAEALFGLGSLLEEHCKDIAGALHHYRMAINADPKHELAIKKLQELRPSRTT